MDWLLQIFDPANIGAFFTQFKNEMATGTFWVALGKIMWINILLSGDNALVIALACRKLPEEQRTAIVLKEYHGLTFQEIADLQGCPLSTVKTRLYQGLSVLRRELARNPGRVA